jgi:hypothetical protein
MMMGFVPVSDRPMVAVRQNLPDGIVWRSHWPTSLKSDVLQVGGANPVTLGLMAAMAIPAFNKVRDTSQEKVVQNNLRQLQAAAAQHMLETGRERAIYAELVGPGRYIRELKPVAGEDYSKLIFRRGQPVNLRLPSGKLITMPPLDP